MSTLADDFVDVSSIFSTVKTPPFGVFKPHSAKMSVDTPQSQPVISTNGETSSSTLFPQTAAPLSSNEVPAQPMFSKPSVPGRAEATTPSKPLIEGQHDSTEIETPDVEIINEEPGRRSPIW